MKRFWKVAEATELENGFGVALDGRVVKTPAKSTLVVPTRALAEAIAAEWDAQEDKINPETMPFTRLTNSAIDKVALQHAVVADLRQRRKQRREFRRRVDQELNALRRLVIGSRTDSARPRFAIGTAVFIHRHIGALSEAAAIKTYLSGVFRKNMM